MRHLPEGPALVLSPHLDDAVYSAWTVITRPQKVTVANVCTGVPSPGACGDWDRVLGATDSAALMRLRLSEDGDALALAGRRPINLGFLEAQYRDGQLDADEVLAALGRETAGASAVYAPAGVGRHPDHQVTREVALRAGAGGCPVFLYAELPYATRFGWPPSITGEPQRPYLRPEACWEQDLTGVPGGVDRLLRRVERLSDEQAARKLRAMKTYRTQFPALNGGPLDQLSHPQITRFEVVWELRPA